MLQKILDTAAERNWQVTSVNLDSLTEVTFIKLLTDLDYKKEFQIIIDCEMERLNSIINLVKEHKSNCPGQMSKHATDMQTKSELLSHKHQQSLAQTSLGLDRRCSELQFTTTVWTFAPS